MRSGDQRLAPDSVVVASSSQVSADLSAEFTGETVILDLNDGVYYELNHVGARVWELIQEPRRVETVLDRLLESYDVTREQCEQDLMALLAELSELGLIEIRHG
jgi:hypothetical protein